MDVSAVGEPGNSLPKFQSLRDARDFASSCKCEVEAEEEAGDGASMAARTAAGVKPCTAM